MVTMKNKFIKKNLINMYIKKMYNKIINPLNNKKYSINSKEGKLLLKELIKSYYNMGGNNFQQVKKEIRDLSTELKEFGLRSVQKPLSKKEKKKEKKLAKKETKKEKKLAKKETKKEKKLAKKQKKLAKKVTKKVKKAEKKVKKEDKKAKKLLKKLNKKNKDKNSIFM